MKGSKPKVSHLKSQSSRTLTCRLIEVLDTIESRHASRTCSNCGTSLFPVFGELIGGLCIRCRLKWRHSSANRRLLVNQEGWSEASKRSRSYEPNIEMFYFDEYYWCENCGAPSVFTAAQQKHEFEVKKKYIHRRRKLCDPCWLQQKGKA